MKKIAVFLVVILMGTGCIFPGAIYCSISEWEDLKVFTFGDPFRSLDEAIKKLENEEKVHGKESLKLCPFIENVGKEYRNLQDFVNAQECFERSLDLKKRKVLDDKEMDSTRLQLANIYFHRGFYSKAEQMTLEILEHQRETLDEDNAAIANTIHSLAILYRWQGRYDEARSFYLKVIPVMKTHNDPELPYCLKDYAFLHFFEGNFAQAEELFAKALAALMQREEQEGETYLDVASFTIYLADSIAAQGRFSEAEVMYEQLQGMIRARYGKGKFHEKIFHLAIGRFYRNWNRPMEAEQHYRYVASIFFIMGIVPNMSFFLEEIAVFYRKQGNFEEAEIILLKTKEAVESEYGKDHPSLASILRNLGVLYREWGRMTGNKDKYEFSEKYLNESIQLTSKSVSGLHPCRNCLFHELALLYHYQGKLEEAEELYKRAIDNYVEGFGPRFVQLRQLLLDLSRLCREKGDMVGAEDLEEWAMSVPNIIKWVE